MSSKLNKVGGFSKMMGAKNKNLHSVKPKIGKSTSFGGAARAAAAGPSEKKKPSALMRAAPPTDDGDDDDEDSDLLTNATGVTDLRTNMELGESDSEEDGEIMTAMAAAAKGRGPGRPKKSSAAAEKRQAKADAAAAQQETVREQVKAIIGAEIARNASAIAAKVVRAISANLKTTKPTGGGAGAGGPKKRKVPMVAFKAYFINTFNTLKDVQAKFDGGLKTGELYDKRKISSLINAYAKEHSLKTDAEKKRNVVLDEKLAQLTNRNVGDSFDPMKFASLLESQFERTETVEVEKEAATTNEDAPQDMETD